MVKTNIFITGATGFVGSALVKRLSQADASISAAVLAGENAKQFSPEIRKFTVEPLSGSSDYTTAMRGADIVIHLAARVHIMKDTASDPLSEFRKVNMYGTERLARQAAEAGVKRFVFMSTIGVNGNASGSRPFTETDDPIPHNPYSVSKLEAELALRKICETTGMQVVIVRAPLIYGPGNPGNFLSLLRITSKGFPLPFASVSNRKSFLYVENLADALACCATHPNAAGRTFLISDGDDVSTPDLIRLLAAGMGKTSCLFPFPLALMRFAGKVLGKSNEMGQLLGSLQVDSSKIRRELGWVPPFTMAQGFEKTAVWFKNAR
uniref:NAD-dependent epimerase/dehydratase n=1 Tax=Geobacter sp. (strain M21) TaxID=443144 RepID=C6E0K4_GEOSM